MKRITVEMVKRWSPRWLLRKWLGIDNLHREMIESHLRLSKQIAELTALAADVSVHGESKIIIISRVGGGRVKIINAEFSGLRDVNDFIRFVEGRFGARTSVVDYPRTDERMRF